MIPPLFIYPDDVVEINLIARGLEEFPEELFTYRQLEHLDLGNGWTAILPDGTEVSADQRNTLTTLPDHFEKLPNLKCLNLSGNNISVLPASFLALTMLERLALGGDLNFDVLMNLPILSKLPSLKWLNMLDIPEAVTYRDLITSALPQVQTFIFEWSDLPVILIEE